VTGVVGREITYSKRDDVDIFWGIEKRGYPYVKYVWEAQRRIDLSHN
jgi:hypothetical protein